MVKTFRTAFLFIALMFFILHCSDNLSPEQTEFKKGEYAGSFSLTFKSYKNSGPVTQSGIISVSFNDSTYSYSAVADFSSDTTAADSLADAGYFSLFQDSIVMNDVSWLLMDPIWHNSLYLFGTFKIEKMENKFRIYQDNSFAKWDLLLLLKK